MRGKEGPESAGFLCGRGRDDKIKMVQESYEVMRSVYVLRNGMLRFLLMGTLTSDGRDGSLRCNPRSGTIGGYWSW